MIKTPSLWVQLHHIERTMLSGGRNKKFIFNDQVAVYFIRDGKKVGIKCFIPLEGTDDHVLRCSEFGDLGLFTKSDLKDFNVVTNIGFGVSRSTG